MQKSSWLHLGGKLAMVTGGGSGIGRATCQVFASEGAKVIVVDVNREAGEDTLRSLAGSEHIALTANVADSQSVEELFENVHRKYGRSPEVLINCAGIEDGGEGILKQDESVFDRVIGVNLKGTYLVTRAAIKRMLEENVTKGSIVCISSFLVKDGLRGQSIYAASKSGVIAFTKTISMEVAKKGIRCNAVLPGAVETAMVSRMYSQEYSAALRQYIPMGRFGSPEEIAHVCAFLASEKSSYVTGSSIDVAGGC